jgi:hypothetical protein
MHILKKIFVLVIVFATIFIIHHLLKTRRAIQQKIEEGFGEEEINKIKGAKTPISIAPIQDKYLDLPLREFIVKSSYNSAISGDYASKEMIRFILERGCRLLDFEIYTDSNKIDYVSLSREQDYVMDTLNEDADRLSFADAMGTVNAYSFVNPSPSPDDPLFLSLRLKNNLKKDEKRAAYKRIADILKVSFPNRLYQDVAGKALEVNGSTPLREIMGKVVVIFDTENKFSNFDKYCSDSKNECSEIYSVINIPANVAGGLPIYTYEDVTTKSREPVLQQRDGLGTTIDTFYMVIPPVDDVIQVPSPREVVLSAFPQFMLYKFHINNTNLEEYEKIFNTAQTAFVPISSLLSTKNEEDSGEDEDVVRPSLPKKSAGPLSFKLF